MVMGSSGLPAPVISCISALPMDVGRSETCMGLPSMSACGGTVVTWPSHEPARVFSLSQDLCASDWAKATVESNVRTTGRIRRRVFMCILLKLFCFGPALTSHLAKGHFLQP